MKKTIKRECMVRINTRILPVQSKFIKAQAKKAKITEGDVLRAIISMHMQDVKLANKIK
jgi:hypothetical protein